MLLFVQAHGGFCQMRQSNLLLKLLSNQAIGEILISLVSKLLVLQRALLRHHRGKEAPDK